MPALSTATPQIILSMALLATTLLVARPASACSDLAALGRDLFFDPALSANGTQSCASCHDPLRAFADSRDNGVAGAVSLGADGISLGDRNTPSISYAAAVPAFTRTSDGGYRGGLFHDGRAVDLAAQAAEPPLNPLEMAQPDIAAVVERLRARADYADRFVSLFGADIFDDDEAAYAAMTQAIAAFERGPPFLAFDSRYDRYLRGEYTMTVQEELGRRLFFSDLTNCMGCHLLEANTITPNEPFSDHRYHNIGIPVNPAVRRANGRGAAYRDRGLLENAAVEQASQAGLFRTPSLRNVLLTAPYMHNGVFQKLETAIDFYNQYIVHNAVVGINPETGAPWGEPEVGDNLALDLLREGQPLDQQRIANLIAFLATLTDRRYEHLLPAPQAAAGAHHE